jgi:hypothetical protein
MRASTNSGTRTPISIFAHRGRPPWWPLFVPATADAGVAVGDADDVEEVILDLEDEVVEEALFDAAVVGPNSPLRYAWTSVGSAVNHVGVLSSRNSDQSIRDTAGTFVSAMARIDLGTPVKRTSPREALR